MDGTTGHSAWKSDSNGCGTDGTNFGTITLTSTKRMRSAYLSLRVYARSGGIRAIHISREVDNEFT
ncbi:hypothetical protein AB0C27_50685 [Nonomuraea sp. NPDC048882]|uniref:hypothetical protein n=1 Tax=unclassified Nonomuraea TaxID=2593643 RepID=UPI0033DC846A